jgi:hypothetical protein
MSQGTLGATGRKRQGRIFQRGFGGSIAFILDFWPPELKELIAVVLSHPLTTAQGY